MSPEQPNPKDREHRIADELNLTVSGCDCRRCENLRDIAIVSASRFGKEDERALAAMDRMNRRRACGSIAPEQLRAVYQQWLDAVDGERKARAARDAAFRKAVTQLD